jgi:hypothetical protein
MTSGESIKPFPPEPFRSFEFKSPIDPDVPLEDRHLDLRVCDLWDMCESIYLRTPNEL